ncbi:MAG TPA: hypothetical protein DCL80_13900 [Balneola sp.]|nr:hypothetical protein [Balneola sp.]|tara:strand:+ start:258 stop:1007 length:750 start_codon:yes stop_codon:yes gene_type:complete
MAELKTATKQDLAKAFEADAGSGFEEVTSSDIQIPFIRIIQALSPQLKKTDPSFIEGASQGDIFNTVTKTLWSGEEGILVIPSYFQQKYLEFIPRNQGGGFVGELSPESEDVRKAVRDQDSGLELLENGNELVRTAQHYVKIVHEDGTLESAIVDMKKTQLKKSRQWNSIMLMQKHNGASLPSFANVYRLKSVEDGNDKGSWHSWTVNHERQVDNIDSYKDAKSLHASIKSGELRPALPVDANSDEVPF